MATKKEPVDITKTPDKMLKINQEWMEAYMDANGTAEQISKYLEVANKENSTFNERRKAFCEIFAISFEKKKKNPSQKHVDKIAAMLEKKRAEEAK